MNKLKMPVLVLALLWGVVSCVGKNVSTIDPAKYASPVRVACVGDSITYGSGTTRPAVESYPAQLAALLGEQWQVRNFGVRGANLIKSGDKPYTQQKAYQAALDFNPDVLVLMLGTNDSKPQNWKHQDQFAADAKTLIDSFKNLPARPKVFVCYPIPVVGKGVYGIREQPVLEQQAILAKVAKATGGTVIDLHAVLANRPKLIPDTVHPNAEGAALMADAVYHALTGQAPPRRPTTRPTSAPAR
ncbi:MAG: GDSL-type esterase/lipase family protein [Tepidisphaeraceae bacterium]